MNVTEPPDEHARMKKAIRSLRVENRQLRARLRNAPGLVDQGLPEGWHKTLTGIRRENSKYRTERNQALAELAQLRAECGAVPGA